MIKLLLLFILIFLISPSGFSQGAQTKRGVRVDAALGYPSISLGNPDGTTAIYEGISTQGRGMLPLFENDKFAALLNLSARYNDLTNTGNNNSQQEVANQIGPGIGLQFQVGKLKL